MTDQDLPPYRPIAAELRDRIRAGDLGPGDRPPSQHDLVAAYGVARATAQAAIRLLQSEGLVASRQGAGAYVTDPAGWGMSPYRCRRSPSGDPTT